MLTANKTSLDFSEVPQFSSFDQAFQREEKSLQSFYPYKASLEEFDRVIKNKSYDSSLRQVLCSELRSQHTRLGLIDSTRDRIQRLEKKNTFVLTTAHQPVILSGPLYTVYKIASTINLAEQLQKKYPEYDFIPVFIAGGEDHDFEEMSSTQLYGNRIAWNNEGTGPVGRFSLDGLEAVFNQLNEILNRAPYGDQINDILRSSMSKADNYGDFALKLVHHLFEQYDLLVMSMDSPVLKKEFIPLIEKEIFESASAPLVRSTQKDLEQKGFTPQAYVREINFFYIDTKGRNRIELEGDQYSIVDSDQVFSTDELKKEIHAHPERFSPNVIMRPLYQEYILPNLAYIGGGGELAYWIERQKQFEAFGIPYPMLIRRNSALWLSKGDMKKVNKLDLSVKQLFTPKDQLLKSIVEVDDELEKSLNGSSSTILRAMDEIKNQVVSLDSSLSGFIEAERVKMGKQMDFIQDKIYRTARKRQEIKIGQAEKLIDRLFPNAGLQERSENIFSLYGLHGPSIIDFFVRELNPMDRRMLVFEEA